VFSTLSSAWRIWAIPKPRPHRRQGDGLVRGASLVSLLTGMILVNLLRPGDNLNLPLPDAQAATNLKSPRCR